MISTLQRFLFTMLSLSFCWNYYNALGFDPFTCPFCAQVSFPTTFLYLTALFLKDGLDVLTSLSFCVSLSLSLYIYFTLAANISCDLLYFTLQNINIIYKLWPMVGTGYQSPGSNWCWLNQINVMFAELWPCQLTWVQQIN